MTSVLATEAAESPLSARDRLLHGLGLSIKERGYRDTKVSDIVAHARTSRRTFYEEFATKEECFLALMVEVNDRMQRHIMMSINPDDPWDEQVRSGITAWIQSIGHSPELSVSWIRELPSLGAVALDGQRQAMKTFSAMLEALTSTPQMRKAGIEPVTGPRAAFLLGGLRELAAGVIENGTTLESITEVAVDAALALLGPRPSRRRTFASRGGQL